MIQTRFLSCILFLCIFTAISSCSKTETQPSMASKLYGKWKKVQYATDDNANGQLDEWELHNTDEAITNVLEFRKDSTGTEYTTGSPDLPFSWIITSELTMAFSYHGSEAIQFRITRVNSGVLHITTRTDKGLAGYYYQKTN